MKKVLFLLLLFIGSIATSNAQNVQEVVYLKNGSVVRGVVIEQVPGISLKVQTSDGSIFAYQMSEVEKITKETAKSNYSFNRTQGYKGFIDLGYTIGAGDWGVDRIELTTSHGYQFNPYLYIGAGVSANYYYDAELFGLPFFAHARANLINNSISPYIDFKIGYSIIDIEGFYMSPSIGCKIKSFNIGVGYVLQKADVYYDWSENIGGISIKLGFEF